MILKLIQTKLKKNKKRRENRKKKKISYSEENLNQIKTLAIQHKGKEVYKKLKEDPFFKENWNKKAVDNCIVGDYLTKYFHFPF